MTDSIALILPCLNEAAALPGLFEQIAKYLPDAKVHIFDNGSTDRTADVATQFGATVHRVFERGKGNVVARMFADVDAEIYVMLDGDGTYPLDRASEHIGRVQSEQIDMLIGSRLGSYDDSASRSGHRFGNEVLSGLVRRIFHASIMDVLSGYRVMSRRFVKSAPVLVSGFEIEVMLTIHALEIRSHIVEAPVGYLKRAEGSASKLRTLRDGARILWAIVYFFKEVRPFRFFSTIALLLALISLAVGLPVIVEFFKTGLVPRFPSAILASAIMLASVISLTCGLILDSVASQRRELKRLFYLSQGSPRIAAGGVKP